MKYNFSNINRKFKVIVKMNGKEYVRSERFNYWGSTVQ